MKEKFIKINNLSVDKILADFIDNELLLGTNVSPKKFWDGFDKVVHENKRNHTKRNRSLAQKK